jgi:hypothetical protein
MKNVTIALDDEIHRLARIRAAELGTSLSALVKRYLETLVEGPPVESPGVRDMQMSYRVEPAQAFPLPAQKGPEGQPYCVNGKWVWTKDGKPRKPGALRHLGGGWTPEFDEWPDGFIDAMYGEDTEAANNWWKPFAKPPAKSTSK